MPLSTAPLKLAVVLPSYTLFEALTELSVTGLGVIDAVAAEASLTL